MESPIKRGSLIALDDDSEVLRAIVTAMTPFFNVLTTSDPRRALGWLQNDPTVEVILVEQVLRAGLGLDVLEQAQQIRPAVKRLLITEYNDLASIMDGLHNGTIQKMVSKPLMRMELAMALSLYVQSSARVAG